MPLYLSTAEFVSRLRDRLGTEGEITDRAVRYWLASGRLRGRKFKSRWRVLASEVDRIEREMTCN